MAYLYLASKVIEVGMVSINEQAIARAEMPFGDVKKSDIGRQIGSFGIQNT
jgi:succinate-semialdehyde dehydrogenase/glutarate-semialdehyde dehydrogenase